MNSDNPNSDFQVPTEFTRPLTSKILQFDVIYDKDITIVLCPEYRIQTLIIRDEFTDDLTVLACYKPGSGVKVNNPVDALFKAVIEQRLAIDPELDYVVNESGAKHKFMEMWF